MYFYYNYILVRHRIQPTKLRTMYQNDQGLSIPVIIIFWINKQQSSF